MLTSLGAPGARSTAHREERNTRWKWGSSVEGPSRGLSAGVGVLLAVGLAFPGASSQAQDGDLRLPDGTAADLADEAVVNNTVASAINVSFGASSYTATEGVTAATVAVTLDRPPNVAVTIPLTTTGLGVAASSDYSGVPSSQSSLTFASRSGFLFIS